jgi:monoamine oxidase
MHDDDLNNRLSCRPMPDRGAFALKPAQTVTRRAALCAGLGAFAAPAAAQPQPKAPQRLDVIVIGAGLSGLHAAGLLEAAGLTVKVLESSARIGGRLMTLDDLPGRPDSGGAQFGGSSQRVLAIAKALNLPLVQQREAPRQSALAIAGKVIAPTDWANADENPFPAPYRTVAPASLLFRLAGPDNPLGDDLSAWRSPAALARDVTADAYLARKGFNAPSRGLIDIGANANSLDTYSMLNVWRSLTLFRRDGAAGGVFDIKGGSQRLTEAMAAKLKGGVQTRARVAEIETQANQVNVTLQNGQSLLAPFVVCAMPFAALRGVSVKAPLNPAQRQAIAQIAYTQIIQIHLEIANRFWEQDGQPADLWSDGPLERIFTQRDRETGQPTGLHLAWINGAGCEALKGQSDAAIEALAQAELKRLGPAGEGKVKVRRIVRWTEENAHAGGAYMHWGAGQIGRWAGDMGKPAQNLFFAGEHLSFRHTGMEGAMESAEAAALGVIATAGAGR